MRLSIVIGAFKEEKRLGRTLDELLSYLKKYSLLNCTEVIIVVANSADKTLKIAKLYANKFPNLIIIEPGTAIGKGRDIKLGMLTAVGDVRIFMDADLATPLHHIMTSMHIIENKGADVVIGVRDLNTMHNSLARKIISIIGNICFSIVSGMYIRDTQCGFKAFNGKVAGQCFNLQTRNNWSFDMEILIIALVNHESVAFLPIKDWVDVPGGTFKVGFKNSLIFFIDLCTLMLNKISKKYSYSTRVDLNNNA